MIPEVVRVPMHQRYLHTLVAADGTESELSAVLRNFQNAFSLQFFNRFQTTARTSPLRGKTCSLTRATVFLSSCPFPRDAQRRR